MKWRETLTEYNLVADTTTFTTNYIINIKVIKQ
jgi:hypothetical protein